MKPETLRNGFKRCGLSPFDVNAVDFTKIDVFNNTVPKRRNIGHETPIQPPISEKNLTGLRFLESFIDPDSLKEFNETYNRFTPIWNGAESAHDLYVVWKKAKDKVTNTISASAPEIQTVESNISEPHLLRSQTSVHEVLMTTEEVIEPMPSTSNAAALEIPFNEDKNSRANSPERNRESARIDSLTKVLSPETNGEGVPTPLTPGQAHL